MKCNHAGEKDLTQGLGIDRHIYCPKCGAHWWMERFYTKNEWDAWIEEGERNGIQRRILKQKIIRRRAQTNQESD